MGFLCYLREERVAFGLSVFRKIFAFAATVEGVVYFSSHVCTFVGTANKVHRWSENLIVVYDDFAGVLGKPHQPVNVAFLPLILQGVSAQLFESFRGRRFDVIFWRLNVNTLLEIHPNEGKLWARTTSCMLASLVARY
ncbi:hypothetical protein KSP40_PGU015567 [Platanthera guangdongensis]|uniref:Uncharacterized protein n=1 Tax=Platanthera guangdongensis TaxID=2320717 RepID=A0ABR2M0R1_9ASPA